MIGVRLWISSLVKNFSLIHLLLVNSKKDILADILLDIPRDMYPFSVFGSGATFLLSHSIGQFFAYLFLDKIILERIMNESEIHESAQNDSSQKKSRGEELAQEDAWPT